MLCFFENHNTPYVSRCGSVVKVPGPNIANHEINSLSFRSAMLWNIIPENIKLSKMLPEIKRSLKKHLIP